MKYSPVQNYINGQFVAATSNVTLEVVSPLDGTLLSTVPMSASKDLNDAVAAAKKAFPSWSKHLSKKECRFFLSINFYWNNTLMNWPNCVARRMVKPMESP